MKKIFLVVLITFISSLTYASDIVYYPLQAQDKEDENCRFSVNAYFTALTALSASEAAVRVKYLNREIAKYKLSACELKSMIDKGEIQ